MRGIEFDTIRIRFAPCTHGDPSVDSPRKQRVEELFWQAVEQPPNLRASFIRHICGADEPLRVEVESLLAADDSGDTFLAVPALDRVVEEQRILAAPPPSR